MHPESSEIGLVCPGAGQNLDLAWLGVGLYDGAKAARVWRGVLRFWNASCLGKAMTSTVRKSSPADRAAAAPGGDRPPRMADDDRKRKGEPGGPGKKQDEHRDKKAADEQ